MVITRKGYREIIDTLKKDLGIELRFTARVIFVNKLSEYRQIITDLAGMADEVIRLSDDAYCAGKDSVPDLRKVSEHISNSTEKNLLITSVGEYLRYAKSYESNVKNLRSIMTYQAHSRKRVWIPIYSAKDIFQDVVGELSDERYELYELEEADEFECFVYPDTFSEKKDIVSICGLKQMYRTWDNLDMHSGMSFSTGKFAMIKPSTGNYSVYVIKSPFEFIQKHIKSANIKLEEKLGTNAFWTKLATYAASANGTPEDILKKALNVADFDAQQIVSGWSRLGDDDGFGRWLLWLWYKLGLVAHADYLGYAIKRAETSNDIQKEIECAILNCVQSPSFDFWVNERMTALKSMGITKLSHAFWQAFDSLSDERTKLKLLSATTSEERTKIIEIVSKALNNNKKITDYKSILAERYPDLLLYFKESEFLTGSLGEYIQTYKQFKIMDYYDRSVSDAALNVDTFEYDPRSKILNSIKCSKDAYYLWIDGMGVEWTDMLVNKVVGLNKDLSNPKVEIGTAIVSTTTKVNMNKADPETVSGKYNKLDSLSHIKDKSDCNYFSIIDKQFKLMEEIANMIVKLAEDNPGKAIVVTADHGMSRIAAKAFHTNQGLTPPAGSTVENLGRFCILQDGTLVCTPTHAYKEDNYLIFKEHSHFTCSGNAPGEIHGGASPEELFVPVITFKNDKSKKASSGIIASYKLTQTVYTLDAGGNINVKIHTQGEVKSLAIESEAGTFNGVNCAKDYWSVTIPGLVPKSNCNIRIYLNNVFSDKVDTISVKRKGLDIDEDF